MSQHTVFFSYASADLPEAEALEAWLQAPPRQYGVWRDRSGIPPGAPAYYAPILEGIRSSANFLVQLSPRWLRSRVSAQEIVDASALGKKIVPVVHPAIPRDPSTPQGRASKSELFEALAASPAQPLLEPINWVWLLQREGEPVDPGPVAEALATDFDWKRLHTLIVQKLARWQQVQDASALARGAELAALIDAAFSGAPGREPRLTQAQRDFLLASQRQDAAERQRTEALHAGAHARSLAFAARERCEPEPDTALLLASAAATAAAVPEARAALGLLLHRHAALTRVLHGHGSGRRISGLAISPQGDRFASTDRCAALGDERDAQLLIHDLRSGQRVHREALPGSFTAVAWGRRWLAAAARGSIGWLRWDEEKRRYRGNSPTALEGDVAPDFLAFSPPSAQPQAGFEQGELLAWATRWGDIGLIRVGDHARVQTRVAAAAASDAITGLAWLADGRLLLAEAGRIVVRHPFALQEARELAAPGRVFSLSCVEDRWVASCATRAGHGLLFGLGDAVGAFQQAGPPDLAPLAAWAGAGPQAGVLLGSTSARAGVDMVALVNGWPEGHDQPDQPDQPDGPDRPDRPGAVAARAGRLAHATLLQGEDAPITALAADATGEHIVAGDSQGRVWLWQRTRRSVLVSPAADTPASPPPAAGPAPAPPGAAGGLQTLQALYDSLGIPARVLHAARDPQGHYLYALVEAPGLQWQRWRCSAPASPPAGPPAGPPGQAPAPPETLVQLRGGVPHSALAFVGHERVVFGDDQDLLFMPVDDPAAYTRRSGHDNPVKRLLAAGDLVLSLACSFLDPAVDQLRLWAPTGEPLGLVTLPGSIVDWAIEPEASRLRVRAACGQSWVVALGIDAWAAQAQRMAGRGLGAEERRRYHIDTGRSGSMP